MTSRLLSWAQKGIYIAIAESSMRLQILKLKLFFKKGIYLVYEYIILDAWVTLETELDAGG